MGIVGCILACGVVWCVSRHAWASRVHLNINCGGGGGGCGCEIYRRIMIVCTPTAHTHQSTGGASVTERHPRREA